MASSENLVSYERIDGLTDEGSSPGRENSSYQRGGLASHDESSSGNTTASAFRKIASNIKTARSTSASPMFKRTPIGDWWKRSPPSDKPGNNLSRQLFKSNSSPNSISKR